MSNEKIVLQSAAPLSTNEKSWTKVYLLTMAIGTVVPFIVFVLLALNANPYQTGFEQIAGLLLCSVMIGLLATGVAWGIREKSFKYKCYGLRNLCFKTWAVLPGEVLCQRLFPVFSSYNIPMEVIQNGIIKISYHGLNYDIVNHVDNSFSVMWYMPIAKAFAPMLYQSLYKKITTDMGLIAFHVQRACYNEDENYVLPMNETFTQPVQPSQPAVQAAQPYYKVRPANPYNGMAITALVLGIVGILSCCFAGIVSMIFGIAGLVFAICSRRYNGGKMSGMAIAGMVCSIIALVLGVIWLGGVAIQQMAVDNLVDQMLEDTYF